MKLSDTGLPPLCCLRKQYQFKQAFEQSRGPLSLSFPIFLFFKANGILFLVESTYRFLSEDWQQ